MGWRLSKSMVHWLSTEPCKKRHKAGMWHINFPKRRRDEELLTRFTLDKDSYLFFSRDKAARLEALP